MVDLRIRILPHVNLSSTGYHLKSTQIDLNSKRLQKKKTFFSLHSFYLVPTTGNDIFPAKNTHSRAHTQQNKIPCVCKTEFKVPSAQPALLRQSNVY